MANSDGSNSASNNGLSSKNPPRARARKSTKKLYVIPLDGIKIIPNSLEVCSVSPLEQQRIEERGQRRRALNYIPTVIALESQPQLKEEEMAMETVQGITNTMPPLPEEETTPIRRVSTTSEDVCSPNNENDLAAADSFESQKPLPPLKKRHSRHKKVSFWMDNHEDEATRRHANPIVQEERGPRLTNCDQSKRDSPESRVLKSGTTRKTLVAVEFSEESDKSENQICRLPKGPNATDQKAESSRHSLEQPQKMAKSHTPLDRLTAANTSTMARESHPTDALGTEKLPLRPPVRKRGYSVDRANAFSPRRAEQHEPYDPRPSSSVPAVSQQRKLEEKNSCWTLEREVPAAKPKTASKQVVVDRKEQNSNNQNTPSIVPATGEAGAKNSAAASVLAPKSKNSDPARRQSAKSVVQRSTLAAIRHLTPPLKQQRLIDGTINSHPAPKLAPMESKYECQMEKVARSCPTAVAESNNKKQMDATASQSLPSIVANSHSPSQLPPHLPKTTPCGLPGSMPQPPPHPSLPATPAGAPSTRESRKPPPQNDQTLTPPASSKGKPGSPTHVPPPSNTSAVSSRQIASTPRLQPKNKVLIRCGPAPQHESDPVPAPGVPLPPPLNRTPLRTNMEFSCRKPTPARLPSPRVVALAQGTTRKRAVPPLPSTPRPVPPSIDSKEVSSSPKQSIDIEKSNDTLGDNSIAARLAHEHSSEFVGGTPSSSEGDGSISIEGNEEKDLVQSQCRFTAKEFRLDTSSGSSTSTIVSTSPAPAVEKLQPDPGQPHGACVEFVEYADSSSAMCLDDALNWTDSEATYKKQRERQELEALNILLIDLPHPKSYVENEESLNLICQKMEVPKFSVDTPWRKSHLLMSPLAFRHEVLTPFQEKVRASSSANNRSVNSFHAELLPGQPSDTTYKMELVGCGTLVEDFQLYIAKWIFNKCASESYYGIISDPWSYLIDIVVDCVPASFLCDAVDIKSHGVHVGFWVDLATSNNGGFWEGLLGKSVTALPPFGIAVWDENVHEEDGKVLSICASRHLDIDFIDKTRVIENIYTVDGCLAYKLEEESSTETLPIVGDSSSDGAEQSRSCHMTADSRQGQDDLKTTSSYLASDNSQAHASKANHDGGEAKKKRKRKRLTKIKPPKVAHCNLPSSTTAPTKKGQSPTRNRSLVISETADQPCDLFRAGDSKELDKQPKQRKAPTEDPNKAPAKLAFEGFKKKAIFETIEFRRYMPWQWSMSCMWTNHKLHFGSSCGLNCPCLWQLPKLTSNVVEKYLSHQLRKADDDWSPPSELSDLDHDETPTGFCTTFAPRFTPLLRTQYPKDGPVETLDRLLFMWRKHLRQLNFGATCMDSCLCGGGWSVVFKEGSKEARPPKRRRKEAPLPMKQENELCSNVLVRPKLRIPRKETNKRSEKKIEPPPRKTLRKGAFYFDFDVKNKPTMGLSFAMAEVVEDKGSSKGIPTLFCKVSAVADSADPSMKIHVNTKTGVEAVEILSEGADNKSGLVFIESLKDLKLTYHRARSSQSRTTLRVWFTKDRPVGTIVGETWEIPIPVKHTVAPKRPPPGSGQDAGQDSREKQASTGSSSIDRVRFDDHVEIVGHPTWKRKQNFEAPPAKRQCLSQAFSENAPVDQSQDDGDSHQWVLLYLQVASSVANQWRSQEEIEARFFERGGFRDKREVRLARNLVHQRKLVENGRQALSLEGKPVVPAKEWKEGLSKETYNRLTEAGFKELAFIKEESPTKDMSSSICRPLLGRAFDDGKVRPPRPPPPPKLLDLPAISPTWYMTGGTPKQCDRFWTTHRPKCQKSCCCLHLQPYIGPPVDSKSLKFQMKKDVMYMENHGENCSFWTAVYHDRELNIYYRAEGGEGMRNKRDGVYYYSSKDAAKTAVSRAHEIAALHPNQIQALERPGRSSPPVPGHNHYGPAKTRPRPPPPSLYGLPGHYGPSKI